LELDDVVSEVRAVLDVSLAGLAPFLQKSASSRSKPWDDLDDVRSGLATMLDTMPAASRYSSRTSTTRSVADGGRNPGSLRDVRRAARGRQ
jgi:hypothetical protein